MTAKEELPDPGDRGLSVTPWLVPGEVILSEDTDRLVWRYRSGSRWPRRRPLVGQLLEEFARLETAPAVEIAKYAAKYGVLYICKRHGRPATHLEAQPPPGDHRLRRIPTPSGFVWLDAPPASRRRTGWFNGCALRRLPSGRYWESVATWRELAAQAAAIVELAPYVGAGDIAPEKSEQWKELTSGPITTIQEARAAIADCVQEWLGDGRVRPFYRWHGASPSLTMHVGNLFGALAVQLMFAVGQSRVQRFCTGCGGLFEPRRLSQIYCEDCGRRAAMRDAQRRRRQRQQEASTLRLQGVPVDEIARRIGSKPATVRRWLRAGRQSR